MDNRAKTLAELVATHSIRTTPQDIVLIRVEDAFSEFAHAISDACRKNGAQTLFEIFNLEKQREIIDNNDDSELEKESKRLCNLAEGITAVIRVDATTNSEYLKNIESKKIMDYSRIVGKPFQERVVGNGKEFKGIKWHIVAYPCEDAARRAGMTLQEYTDLLFGATNIDWKQKKEEMIRIKEAFDNAKEVQIVVPGETDIKFSLKDRRGRISYGLRNMPDGEVFFGPVEDSAEGKILFPYNYISNGKSVRKILLEFKKGKIVSFDAEENKDHLESILKQDGAMSIGEFGIGCNQGITKYSTMTLFDEKMAGTIHLAIGESFLNQSLDDGGGKNKADIHWDLVCDLRKVNGLPGGEIYVDGKLVQRHGKWTF